MREKESAFLSKNCEREIETSLHIYTHTHTHTRTLSRFLENKIDFES